ncbi:MAG: hypothetical protein SGILL_005106 [Bacillariaceae sp.]
MRHSMMAMTLKTAGAVASSTLVLVYMLDLHRPILTAIPSLAFSQKRGVDEHKASGVVAKTIQGEVEDEGEEIDVAAVDRGSQNPSLDPMDDSYPEVPLFTFTEEDYARIDHMNPEIEVSVSSSSSLIGKFDSDEDVYIMYDDDVDTLVLSNQSESNHCTTNSDGIMEVGDKWKTSKRFRFPTRSGNSIAVGLQKPRTKLGIFKHKISNGWNIKPLCTSKPKKIVLCHQKAQTKLGRFKQKTLDGWKRKKRFEYATISKGRDCNSFRGTFEEQERATAIDNDIVDEWNKGHEGLSKTNKAFFERQTLVQLMARNDFFREAWLKRMVRARAESEATKLSHSSRFSVSLLA